MAPAPTRPTAEIAALRRLAAVYRRRLLLAVPAAPGWPSRNDRPCEPPPRLVYSRVPSLRRFRTESAPLMA